MKNSKKTWVLAALPLLTMLLTLAACSNKNGSTTPEVEQTLSEKLIAKWNFVESQEKKDGQWVKVDQVAPEKGSEEFREDSVMVVSYTYEGETNEYEVKWALDDETGELTVIDEEEGATNMATISFSEDGDTLYISYGNFKHLDDPAIVSSGEYRDVHLRDKEVK